MKKFKKFTIPFIALAVLFLSACAVIAKTPLAKENEVHEKLLAGDWQVLDEASKDIQVYMIRDNGKHYSMRCRKNGVLEKEQVNFALVKLNGQYFAGFPLDKKAYIVLKIDVTEKAMTFYTLSTEILPEYSKISDKDSVATVSIGELRKWCADHVKDFSQPAFKFKRISASNAVMKTAGKLLTR